MLLYELRGLLKLRCVTRAGHAAGCGSARSCSDLVNHSLWLSDFFGSSEVCGASPVT